MLRLNLIGAGQLGQALGYLFVKTGQVHLRGVHTTSSHTAQAAITFMGAGTYCSDLKMMPQADVYFITTPDRYILDSCFKLCASDQLQPGSIFVHCSGALGAEVLALAKEKKGYIASVHPARSFADPMQSVQQFDGTYCAMEGDTEALAVLEPLLTSIGAQVFKINQKHKSRYHAAMVFASNYLVTLAQQANMLMGEAEIDQDTSMNLIASLMKNTLSNLATLKTPHSALTGPVQRGDVSTIQSHLAVLAEPQQLDLYRSLGQATVHMTNHDEQTKAVLGDLFKVKSST